MYPEKEIPVRYRMDKEPFPAAKTPFESAALYLLRPRLFFFLKQNCPCVFWTSLVPSITVCFSAQIHRSYPVDHFRLHNLNGQPTSS